ncbi:MAG TPA: hypothetical protein VFY48_03185 [Solirubrobacterales bacterium]|nr:hypothetical protein [Solirubrobacterales bacterium]
MALVFGQRYERSAGESPEAFLGGLAEFLRGRLAGLPIELELCDGETVTGAVDSIGSTAVTLERDDGSLIGTFAAADLSAFTLVDEALDRSDELRPPG